MCVPPRSLPLSLSLSLHAPSPSLPFSPFFSAPQPRHPCLWAAPALSALEVVLGPLPAFLSLLYTTPLDPLQIVPLLDSSSQVSPFENAMCFLLGPEVITQDLMMKSCQKRTWEGQGDRERETQWYPRSQTKQMTHSEEEGDRSRASASRQGVQSLERTGSEWCI